MSVQPSPTARRRLATVTAGVGAVACAGLLMAGWAAQEPTPSTVPDSGGHERSLRSAAPVTAPPAEHASRRITANGLQEAPDPEAHDGHHPARLRIPGIGVDSPLEQLGLGPDGALEVPEDPGLAGWFDRSAVPGDVGPTVIAGHVTWEGEPAIFLRLAELEPGNTIVLHRADGATVRYRVTDTEQVAKETFPTDAVYGETTGNHLRLITCGGLYDDAERRYQDNVIVYAELATP